MTLPTLAPTDELPLPTLLTTALETTDETTVEDLACLLPTQATTASSSLRASGTVINKASEMAIRGEDEEGDLVGVREELLPVVLCLRSAFISLLTPGQDRE
jgi:hypothetical protein